MFLHKSWLRPISREITLTTLVKTLQADCLVVVVDDKSGEVIERSHYYLFKKTPEIYYGVKADEILVKAISVQKDCMYIRLEKRKS